MNHNPATSCLQSVSSDFADDPDFADLLAMFVGGLEGQRMALESQFRAGDVDQISRTAHQLKGAGGGYGFPGLTERAAVLESACKSRDPQQVAVTLRHLFEYLSRITG